jgi:hypothetical protein
MAPLIAEGLRMEMTQPVRLVLAAVLFCAWGALVACELAPIGPFVDFLRDALLGLGVFHVTMTNPSNP